MMGIRVRRVKLLVFTFMGAFAAFAGVFATLEVSYFWPSQGEGMLLTALAAVFIGGTSVFGGKGTMLGTFLGVLIIGSLEARSEEHTSELQSLMRISYAVFCLKKKKKETKIKATQRHSKKK